MLSLIDHTFAYFWVFINLQRGIFNLFVIYGESRADSDNARIPLTYRYRDYFRNRNNPQ